MDDRLAELGSVLPPESVRTDLEALEKYGRDWVRLRPPAPLAVCFPTDTDEVVRIVQWARRHHVALVPSGGRTGLSGGALADDRQLVVSCERMDKILSVSRLDQTLTAQAGVVIRKIHHEASRHGLLYPIDFAPVDTMQLGGTIATNAGGVHVCRYGMTRNWVAGLTVVTGTGEVLDLSLSVPKNNTGYDLKQLFIGSEGTLGIITEATVRLTTPPGATSAALLCVRDTSALAAVALEARRFGTVHALEFWDDAAMEVTLAHLNRTRPSERAPWYVLGEFEAAGNASAAGDWARACHGRGLAQAWLQASPAGVPRIQGVPVKDLWDIRLAIGTAVAPYTPYKNDISLPVTALPTFLPALSGVLHENDAASAAASRLVLWGHLGDGNLHVNYLKPDGMTPDAFVSGCREIDAKLYALVASQGGSISAEHGIGLLKKHALSHTRSAAEIAAMRAIKKVFDPDHLMNPGKIFD